MGGTQFEGRYGRGPPNPMFPCSVQFRLATSRKLTYRSYQRDYIYRSITQFTSDIYIYIYTHVCLFVFLALQLIVAIFSQPGSGL